MMKERPILFSTPMVQAIFEGRKTQTRRIVKPQPLWIGDPNILFKKNSADPKGIINCKYGYHGDRLWVRETTEADEDTSDYVILSRYTADKKPVLYSGCEDPAFNGTVAHWDYTKKVRPSIHMPRWASRILLEITDIKVERIQDISEDDAKAEGIKSDPPKHWYHTSNRKTKFMQLWDSISKKRGYGWEANPWVWVIHFKVLEVKR